jgi:hypothetical protein
MGMPFIWQVMMVPAYVAQKLNQLNRHRKKLFNELFFIVSMENNKDTEILEFVVLIALTFPIPLNALVVSRAGLKVLYTIPAGTAVLIW